MVPGVRKIPAPTMMPTTMARPSQMPSDRLSAGIASNGRRMRKITPERLAVVARPRRIAPVLAARALRRGRRRRTPLRLGARRRRFAARRWLAAGRARFGLPALGLASLEWRRLEAGPRVHRLGPRAVAAHGGPEPRAVVRGGALPHAEPIRARLIPPQDERIALRVALAVTPADIHGECGAVPGPAPAVSITVAVAES